ncbi:hypothetical protein ACFROC_01935 [Nocardia tengchongensis]|uniref:hypothetical protein n=1 Tax=Nocardia tengchongensis TaxID=2055889 RepID=UPI00368739AA
MIKYSNLTPRACEALVGLTEMRGMQLDVLADFMNVGRTQVYDLANRLLTANTVNLLEMVQRGPKWVVPTREAAGWVLGWRPGDWQPRPNFATHCRAVAKTRVALGACATGQWISDRIMRHEHPGPGRYPYDGLLLRGDHRPVAVKVDTSRHLTGAELARRLNTVVRQAHHDECAEILYVCDGYLTPDYVATVARQTLPDIPDLALRVTRLDKLTSIDRLRPRRDAHARDGVRRRATGATH